MIIPESVIYVAERLKKEIFYMDEKQEPSVDMFIRPHSDPKQGWVVEINIKPPYDAMLPLSPTIRGLGYGAVTWDLERNAIILSGVVNNIPVCVFITREHDRFISTSRN